MATGWRRPMLAGVISNYTGNAAVAQPRARNRRRQSAAYGHIRHRFREHAPGPYVPIRRHHRQRRPRGSQGNKPGDDHDPRYQRDATSSSPVAVRSERTGPLEDHAVHVPADAGAVRRGLLRHLGSPPPGFGHVPHPLAVAEHDAAPRSTCPYRGVQVDVGVAGAVRVPALRAVGAAGGHASRPPRFTSGFAATARFGVAFTFTVTASGDPAGPRASQTPGACQQHRATGCIAGASS